MCNNQEAVDAEFHVDNGIYHFFKSILNESENDENVSSVTFEISKNQKIVHIYNAETDEVQSVDITEKD